MAVFGFIHCIVTKYSDILNERMNKRTNEHTASIFRVTAMVREDAEVMGSKKMSDIYGSFKEFPPLHNFSIHRNQFSHPEAGDIMSIPDI